MNATFEQEREELNNEILKIKQTLLSMEDDEFLEEDDVDDDDDEDVLCVDVGRDSVSALAVRPVHSEQDTAADSILQEDQLMSFAGSSSTLQENSLRTALSLNCAYQEVITNGLEQVKLALDQNRERQMVMKEELDQERKERNSSRKNAVTAFAVPYFRDVKGMNPPINVDTLIKRESKEGNPFIKAPKQWMSREKKKLREAVRSDSLRRHMRPLMNRKEILMAKQFETSSLENLEDIGKEIEQLDNDIEDIKGWSDTKLFGSRLDTSSIDWLKISSIDFDGDRSAMACELMWKNVIHPSINSTKWRSEEDTRLDEIVRQHKEREWEAIAEELGTNRTAFQCLQRYQTRLNPCLATGKWTPEEDKFLLEVIASSTTTADNIIPWSQVADYLEGRSQEQCAARWARLKELERVKSRSWSTEEDMKLIQAVQWFGPKSWGNVSKFVPGRSDIQCRERWINALDSNLKIGNWTYEEDRIIWLSVQQHGGGKWVKLAEQLPGRTDNMILHRYNRMKRCRDAEEQLLQLPMTKKMREAASENMPAVSAQEAKMICADKDKGIDVPRPVKGGTSRYVKMLELRRQLHEMIKLRVQRGITFSSNSSTPMHLDAMLESDDYPGIKTVRSMLDTSRKLEKNLNHKGGKVSTGLRKGRQKSSLEDRKVRLEIIELIQRRTGKRPPGRPRIRCAEEADGETLNNTEEGNTLGPANTDNPTEARIPVAKTLFQSLQVNIAGMMRRARQLKNRSGATGGAPSSSTNWHPRKQGLHDNVLDLWDAVAMETTSPIVSEDDDGCVETNKSKRHPTCPLVAIPPNTTTLRAFKSLLLRKRSLSVTAGRTLPPKPCLTTGGSTKTVAAQRSCATSFQSGSTHVIAIPSSSSSNKVTVIDLHNQNMKVNEIITIQNMVSGPQDGTTAAGMQELAVPKESELREPEDYTLERIRNTHNYKLLRERVHAIFLWPALLSAIPLDNLPSEPQPNAAPKKKRNRFPYSRGKKYRKYVMKRTELKAVHKSLCRKNIEAQIQKKKQGISSGSSVAVISNRGDELAKLPQQPDEKKGSENPTMETEQTDAPVEGKRNRRGRPVGGGKKRTWQYFGERQTRGRSQREANTKVVPDIVIPEVCEQSSAPGLPPEGAVNSNMVCSSLGDPAFNGMNVTQTQVATTTQDVVMEINQALTPEDANNTDDLCCQSKEEGTSTSRSEVL